MSSSAELYAYTVRSAWTLPGKLGGRGILRALIDTQIWLSRKFDRLLPEKYRADGNTHFRTHFAPGHVPPGALVYDIGSGRHPFLSPECKRALQVRVVGLDIDPAEIAAAPAECYDEAVCCEVTTYRGKPARRRW